MKNKTEIAVKITDKNREKVRGILDMFWELYESDIFSYEDICYEPECKEWGGGVVYKNKVTYVKPKQLRNILAKEHLKEGDVVVCKGVFGDEYFFKIKSMCDTYFQLDSFYDSKNKQFNEWGGCFLINEFLRYATEEEKALLEPKKELEIGRWYKGVSDNTQLLFKVDCSNKDVNYGFISNKWYEGLYCSRSCEWTEATQQEVEKALIKEAKRRYKVGDKIYFKEDLITCELDLKSLSFISHENTLYCSYNNWSGSCLIFSNGKWADVIKNDDKPQKDDVCKFYDEDEDNFAIGALNSTDFSQLYPYEMKSLACGFRHAKKLTEQEVIDLLFKK